MLCAFGSSARYGIKPEDDANIKSLLSANTPAVAIFGKSWDLHVTQILKITLENNLSIIEETVAYLKECGKEVIFDAEHFFDGYKDNPEYALKALEAAVKGGADTLALCDTNGGAMPLEVYEITKTVVEKFPDVKIGIHCHNDTGCAVASSMMAVDAGASHIQGTFIGIGERCGNADLSVIIPNLRLKCGYETIGKLETLCATARMISEIANTQLYDFKPYTGGSAFAHKAGMHIDGVLKVPGSFEHINPALVGNKRRFLLSEVAGRSTVIAKIQSYAPSLTKDSPEVRQSLKS